ncbi:uncharacterized protein ANIA_11665 [Aspergillus nidulans FGSC A4]|uniref:Uncharacterized protein n=1 Tax=Emericella nidulans (strain FGSC A4 / ATCC 38163 / CBS 112.46 / NRRL 194 / M139) TaxID=227321 RepID=C8VH43_EMENI|nr:hypothetical protein [Aspergillus nidulans FGSC A4]CBF82249.1 TPA: hypothetical protein ANIA_11665 [Aspergillus nidulans FGSC A4]
MAFCITRKHATFSILLVKQLNAEIKAGLSPTGSS